MLCQQQKNPWSWKTEQVHFFPWAHYHWISTQLCTVSFFLCIFIQGCLDWACMTDCLKARKWEALSRWKWNMSTKCDPHEIALAVNGVPWCSVTVPSTFIMHEHVLKLTQILNLLVDPFSYLCFLCNYFTVNKIWERYKNENRIDFWIQFN